MVRIAGLPALICAWLGLATTAAGQADDVAGFYAGKQVNLYIGYSAGGGYDTYARNLARHIGKHIPGNPTLILQNRPGAGGVTANAYMMHAAPKDGSVFAEINPGTMTLPLLRSAKYDPRKFEWMGSVAVRGYCGAVWHTVAADTIDKMKQTTVVMGATGQGSQNFQIPTLMNHLLGTKFKVVSGYKGGGEINLAIETGEVQGRANFYEGFVGAKPDWIRDRKLKFFFTLGPAIPALKDVPTLKSLMKNDEERRMLALIDTTLQLGQAFFLPPGTPKARVDALTVAFAKTMKDAQFLADARKRKLVIEPRTRAENQAVVAEAYEVSPDVAKKVASILGLDKGKKK